MSSGAGHDSVVRLEGVTQRYAKVVALDGRQTWKFPRRR